MQGQSFSTQVASGLSSPLFFTHAPGETHRAFLLEQGSGGTARVKAIDLTTNTVSTYLTISGIQTGGERGLLGLAFHPDFANNGHLYVNVTAAGQTQIRRYTASGTPSTSTSANASTMHDVLQFNQPFSNHNGGWIGFNPAIQPGDPQYLYIGTGDGGSGGDPLNNSQDITNNWLGKMLRVDIDNDDFPASATRNYAIPSSNPFVGATGDDEIWAYGLRNPFRNSFDSETGDLWIGDVGQNQLEEIDYQPAESAGGENYGWRVKEGTNCYDNSQSGGNPSCSNPTLVEPIYEYSHNGGSFGGFSVTGGYVYRGSVDRFVGDYFFGDYATDHVWSIDPYALDPQASVLNRDSVVSPNTGTISGISSFGEDGNGELYIVSHASDRVHRVDSSARVAQWNGASAVGTQGDGSTWNDPNNWTRNGVVDTGFSNHDTVEFLPGASPNVNLQTARTVSAIQFRGSYELTGPALQVLSGNVTVDAGVTASFSGDLSAETINRSIRKWGQGRFQLNGATQHVAAIEGTFGGNASVNSITVYTGATVAPGSGIGTLNVRQQYDQQAGTHLEIELGGTQPGSTHDQVTLDSSSTATLAGDLDLLTVNGYTLSVRGTVDNFVVIDGGQVSGNFDDITYDGSSLVPFGGVDPNGDFRSHAGDGLFQSIAYSNDKVVFQNYLALPGDADGNGFVDASDFNVWNANKFTSGTDWTTGDFDGSGTTDVSDFILWNQFKFSAASLAIVPEPTPLAMLWSALGMLAMGSRWARRNRGCRAKRSS